MANEVAKKKEFTTTMSEWTNAFTGLVTTNYDKCGVELDDYSKNCAMNAMRSIYTMVTTQKDVSMSDIDTSNLGDIVTQCAALKLNANALPRECYFQIENKKVGNAWKKVVTMKPEGDGYDAMLRHFGNGVKTVHPFWLVKEGDDYVPPRHRGIEVTPPEWSPKMLSNKTARVVYPIELTNGKVEYLIAERESVKTNLMAHIRNNMMNETFGICADRFKATPQQKEQINEKKQEILSKIRSLETVDDILACEEVRKYISAAWLDTPEEMIIRKMRNNAIKKYPKDMNSIAKQSYTEIDDTYIETQEEIEENSATEDLIVESVVVDSDDVEDEPIDYPDFLKD